jgi:hypothetical protein
VFSKAMARATSAARTDGLCLSFPGMLPPAKTNAAWPVWRDSTTKEARFAPMTKRQAVRLWHDARRFERQTRQARHQDGAIGRNGLAILHALLFDFLNYRSGALYPSQAAIAEAAAISERSVARGLAKLKESGVLDWLRRAVPVVTEGGGFILRQISNAYHVCSTANWKGYKPPPPPPPPAPGTWGDHPPMPGFADTKLAAAVDLLGGLVGTASLAMKPSC